MREPAVIIEEPEPLDVSPPRHPLDPSPLRHPDSWLDSPKIVLSS